jgi:hypothetical protein
MSLLDHIAPQSATAPVMVIFGGNPHRRDEVLRDLATLGDFGAYAALSQSEGMELMLEHRSRLRLVLIGGAYSVEERQRIKAWAHEQGIDVPFTEPGVSYPYDNARIRAEVRRLLGLKTK